MIEALRLYVHYVALSVRGQLQYRASTLMMTAGHLLTTGVEFVALWALFERFGQLRGWSLAEVALLYGMANCAFAVAEAFGRDPEFFAFYRSLTAYERALQGENSTLVISPDSEFFDYLKADTVGQ